MGGIYLSKTVFKTLPEPENQSKGNESHSESNPSGYTDDQEVCVESAEIVIKLEYHIVYSMSYSVPVLYFSANKSDGSVVPLEDIWKWVPNFYKSEVSESETEISNDSDLYRQLGSVLTQMEHPLLGRPFYCIHPCNTSTLMKNIFGTKHFEDNRSSNTNIDSYLISWLSTMGPMAGLHISLEYAK